MRCLILVLCWLQFGVNAFDWLNRTIRVDFVVDRTHRDFDPRYDSVKPSETILSSAINATNGQYPWSIFTMAWMNPGGGWRIGFPCSGTIISENFALSEYYCTAQQQSPPANSIELYIGQALWPISGRPSNYVRHLWYIEPSPENDPTISLFRLDETLIFNPNIRPIRLPFHQDFSYEGWSSLLLGYHYIPTQLKSVQTSITNNGLCNIPIDEHQICGIQSRERNEYTSVYEGGAWIVHEYTDEGFMPVLIGIHRSMSIGESYGRASRVSHFAEWIETLSAEF